MPDGLPFLLSPWFEHDVELNSYFHRPATYAHDEGGARVEWLPPTSCRRWRDTGLRGIRGRRVGADNLCHQAIFMDHATGTVVPPNAEVV